MVTSCFDRVVVRAEISLEEIQTMNRYRMRFAPQVWKPSLSPTLVRWLQGLRHRQQSREVNIEDVHVSGEAFLREAIDRNEGVMIMPNHSSHADPFIIHYAADQVRTPIYIMATWHVFHEKPKLVQWLLTKHGCFSVDREANDVGAFRLATEILRERPQPLVIFPEGEIYHCNERTTPFREGAAAIAVAAARKTRRKIWCVPCAMRYHYVDDPTLSLERIMGDLEESIYWRRREDCPLKDRIYQFAEALLAVKEVEYFGSAKVGELPDRIANLRNFILDGVEKRHGLPPVNGSTPERVKAARKTIMEKLGGNGEPEDAPKNELSEQERVRLDEDLEDLFLVVQSFSYPGDYVGESPSVERMAETIDKFEEDVLQRTTASIKARRKAIVQFGVPIEVSADRKVKNQATTITSQVEQSVQKMLLSM